MSNKPTLEQLEAFAYVCCYLRDEFLDHLRPFYPEPGEAVGMVLANGLPIVDKLVEDCTKATPSMTANQALQGAIAIGLGQSSLGNLDSLDKLTNV